MDGTQSGRQHVDAVAYRDGDWWTIEIPELRSAGPGDLPVIAVGQAASLRGLDAAVRDIAAVWMDVDPDDVDADVTIRLPDEVATLWADAAERDERARESAAAAARIRRAALCSLLDLGVSQSDAARALGLSAHHVGRLVHGDRTRASA